MASMSTAKRSPSLFGQAIGKRQRLRRAPPCGEASYPNQSSAPAQVMATSRAGRGSVTFRVQSRGVPFAARGKKKRCERRTPTARTRALEKLARAGLAALRPARTCRLGKDPNFPPPLVIKGLIALASACYSSGRPAVGKTPIRSPRGRRSGRAPIMPYCGAAPSWGLLPATSRTDPGESHSGLAIEALSRDRAVAGEGRYVRLKPAHARPE